MNPKHSITYNQCITDKIIREIIYAQIVADDNDLCHLASEPSNSAYTVFFTFKISDWIYPFGINHLFSLAQKISLMIVPKKLYSICNHKTSSTVSQQDT